MESDLELWHKGDYAIVITQCGKIFRGRKKYPYSISEVTKEAKHSMRERRESLVVEETQKSNK
jgi:hypothetical protein